jgi:2-polyprenyl-3-methyl-5-hydroxy-6-metoxy-1,4-benzoquinol methylase
VILELGCSTGVLGESIKRRQDAFIVGVEPDHSYAAEAATRLDRVANCTAEEFLAARPAEAPFDCLVCADVLEHLVDPWSVLRQATGMLRPDGTAVISLPNVLYWRGLLRVIARRTWPRDDEGIFDRTHLRWFTGSDAILLARQATLEVIDLEPRFWDEGWRLSAHRLLYRTPFGPFLAAQYIVTARRR